MQIEDIPEAKYYENLARLQDEPDFSVEDFLSVLNVDEDCRDDMVEGALSTCKYLPGELDKANEKLKTFK